MKELDDGEEEETHQTQEGHEEEGHEEEGKEAAKEMKPVPHGRRALIYGNGPSVAAEVPGGWGDYDLIIGTNRCLVIKALQGAPFNALVMRDGYRDLWFDNRIGARYHDEYWKPSPIWRVGSEVSRSNTHCNEFVLFADGWQAAGMRNRDRELLVMESASVVIQAANWAWHYGAREITLLGVDYTGGDCAELIPAFAASTGREGRYDKGPRVFNEQQFTTMVAAIESAGGSILNASPGTKLEAVPRHTMVKIPDAPLHSGVRQVGPELDEIDLGHRLRYEWAGLRIKAGEMVLDVGCGCGYGAEILAASGCLYFGIDYSPESIAYAKDYYGSFGRFAVREAHYSCGKYDVLVAFEVLEHLDNPEVALAAWHESLNPQGRLLVSVPQGGKLAKRHPFHLTDWTEVQLVLALDAAGFVIKTLHYQSRTRGEIKLREAIPGMEMAICVEATV